MLLTLTLATLALADSATWKANPSSGDWNMAANWTPPRVPNGASDTATFDSSNVTSVSISTDTQVNGIAFNAGASAFTLTIGSPRTLTISGIGLTNASGKRQTFVTSAPTGRGQTAEILFINSATAGDRAVFVNNGSSPTFGNIGLTKFADDSTAGTASFINKQGGLTLFLGNSSAGNARFQTKRQGGTNFAETATAAEGNFAIESGGRTAFFDNSTAGNGVFSINRGSMTFFNHSTAANGTFTVAGGSLFFDQFSTADNATLIANDDPNGGAGGVIVFNDHATGGKARVQVSGTGTLDIRPHTANVEIGSIEGSGTILLGRHKLTAGSNDFSTNFSGVIQDANAGGSLTKSGTGTLTLNNFNTYTGGTFVKRGELVVDNLGSSGTGTGPVQVDRGSLGGKGIIEGAVSVGTGSGSGAILSPGHVHAPGRLGALTINSALTFNFDGAYEAQLNSGTSMADQVAAVGVTINPGAQFSFSDIGSRTLPIGTAFIVINNTSADPIVGTFSNLADGATFTSNGNTYQASYEGGDGNDLTLTVQ